MKVIKSEQIGVLAVYVDGEFTHIVKANGDTKMYKVAKTGIEDYQELLNQSNGFIKTSDQDHE